MGLKFEKSEDKEKHKTWKLILAYIGAKQTHDPAFQDLFNQVLNDAGHPWNRAVKTLSMLYDFTPLHRPK